jgi:hypothetical protein
MVPETRRWRHTMYLYIYAKSTRRLKSPSPRYYVNRGLETYARRKSRACLLARKKEEKEWTSFSAGERAAYLHV